MKPTKAWSQPEPPKPIAAHLADLTIQRDKLEAALQCSNAAAKRRGETISKLEVALRDAIRYAKQIERERDHWGAELARVCKVIESAGVGIDRDDRPVHDWLAQVLQVLVLRADPMSHIWVCSNCSEMQAPGDARWRWNGERWEHKCGDPQAGHFPAMDMGACR